MTSRTELFLDSLHCTDSLSREFCNITDGITLVQEVDDLSIFFPPFILGLGGTYRSAEFTAFLNILFSTWVQPEWDIITFQLSTGRKGCYHDRSKQRWLAFLVKKRKLLTRAYITAVIVPILIKDYVEHRFLRVQTILQDFFEHKLNLNTKDSL